MMWVLAFALIGSAAAQMTDMGDCPQVDVKHDFDVSQFGGKWFEAQHYFNVLELGGKCATATFTLNPNGTVSVVNSHISTITGLPVSLASSAKQDKKEPAKLKVTIPAVPFPIELPYWVVGTDYNSFAVVWSCRRIGFFNLQLAWLLTREQLPTKATLENAYTVIESSGIRRSLLELTDQQSCS